MIIFVGVAGAGKSLQGKMLADKYGLPWLSTGEFLRMLISGEKRKSMLQGKLLTDQEIIALVQKIFNVVDVSQEFVLDGFPRTMAQADWLLNQHKHGQLHITAVIHLETSKEVVKQRLLARGRQDDHEAAITARFEEYEQNTLPILDHFSSENVPVISIQAEGSVDEVHALIETALKHKIT